MSQSRKEIDCVLPRGFRRHEPEFQEFHKQKGWSAGKAITQGVSDGYLEVTTAVAKMAKRTPGKKKIVDAMSLPSWDVSDSIDLDIDKNYRQVLYVSHSHRFSQKMPHLQKEGPLIVATANAMPQNKSKNRIRGRRIRKDRMQLFTKALASRNYTVRALANRRICL